jgi:hypothetical protein
MVWVTTGVSAAAGTPTDFGLPSFAPSTAADADGNGLPDDLQAAIGPRYFFDFGPAGSPAAAGSVTVPGTTIFTDASEYGWVGPVPRGYDTAAPAAGLTDHAEDARITDDATFAVRVPNGVYDVTVTAGGVGPARQLLVSAGGELLGSVTAATGNPAARTVRVVVSDGVLSLRFATADGSLAAVAGLDVIRVDDFTPSPPPATAAGPFYYAIQNLVTGDVTRGHTTGVGPLIPDGTFLAPSTPYRITVVQLGTGHVGAADFTTAPSGVVTLLPVVQLGPDPSPDSDADGIPDRAEFVIGTDPDSDDPGPIIVAG